MVTLNGKKFALNGQEFTNSLFESGGTCVGYYRVNRKSITLLDHNKVKIGVINRHGVLAAATRLDNDKWRYSFATIKQVGEYESYAHQVNEPKELINNLCTI